MDRGYRTDSLRIDDFGFPAGCTPGAFDEIRGAAAAPVAAVPKRERFNRTMVAKIRSNYGLETRYSRLRARGMLTLREIVPTAKTWRHAGRLRSYRYNDKGETLFDQPGPETPIKYQYQRKNRIESTPSAVGRNPLNP